MQDVSFISEEKKNTRKNREKSHPWVYINLRTVTYRENTVFAALLLGQDFKCLRLVPRGYYTIRYLEKHKQLTLFIINQRYPKQRFRNGPYRGGGVTKQQQTYSCKSVFLFIVPDFIKLPKQDKHCLFIFLVGKYQQSIPVTKGSCVMRFYFGW